MSERIMKEKNLLFTMIPIKYILKAIKNKRFCEPCFRSIHVCFLLNLYSLLVIIFLNKRKMCYTSVKIITERIIEATVMVNSYT